MKILVTGAAGFIGFHLVTRLAELGHTVTGIDNLNDYYPVSLKYARLRLCGIDPDLVTRGSAVVSTRWPHYTFRRVDISNRLAMEHLMAEDAPYDVMVNLAAQAGVRYSIDNPYSYIESNVNGFLNLLECARHNPVRHFIYASSSSVYGGNTKVPFSEDDRVDSPVSLYAATKKSNELFASVYSHLYGIPCTGLRFFTVYGPWGRPDMAPTLFADAIRAGRPIKVFNNGDMSRDFTYIDDIVDGILAIIEKGPKATPQAAVYNIGCGHPMPLMQFIHTLEDALGKKAVMQMLPMQPGDVYTTFADTTALERDYGYAPSTPLDKGIARFVEWIQNYN